MSVLRPVIIVQGAQWGSEAKGAIAAYLCIERDIDYAVRTGAINAGHTVYYRGVPYKMQQLPTGWVNPRTKLVLGPGALVHLPTLMREIGWINEAMPGLDVRDRLYIDWRAGVHLDEHEQRSKFTNRHHKIGATGKGCSEALVDRIRRRGDDNYTTLWPTVEQGSMLKFTDAPNLLMRAHVAGDGILLEGTQGSHLDLLLGPYPYTTHKPCQASQWVVEAGLPLGLEYETILVARTYPIRVAGNSGPMPRETGWPELTRTVNRQLKSAHREPRVKEQSLREFEAACAETAHRYNAPNGRLWTWSADERREHKEAASEIHKEALDSLPEETVQDLMNFFEITTVTKKLRRVAEFDVDILLQSIQWNAPDSIALTFANYWFPELWNYDISQNAADLPPEQYTAMFELTSRLNTLESRLNVPIRYVSFGAETQHIIPRQ